MVKYTLIQKPTMSNWPTVRRRVKLCLALSFLLFVTCLLVFGRSRSTRLGKIYNVQASIADIFDLEIKYTKKRSTADDDEWVPVDDLDGHVYSAYLDVRPEVIDEYYHARNAITWAQVRIIAILPFGIDAKAVDCIYKYDGNGGKDIYKQIRVTAVKAIEENWGLKYSAFFVICDLTVPENINYDLIYNENQLPESVAIARRDERTTSTRFIDIHYPIMGMGQLYEPATKFMALCVPVLHHSFGRSRDLIEFIEYNLLMGVKHFTFYNSSVSPEVDRVLRHYEVRDIATVLSWKLPSKYVFEKTLRFEGLFAGINDCLYRNSFHDNYKYVANFGVDEFLVPRIHENFTDLMNHIDEPLENDRDGEHASFLFRNAFFYTMYDDDDDDVDVEKSTDPNPPYLYTQAKTRRLKEIHKPRCRSRYVVRGRDAVRLVDYYVSELRRGSSTWTKQFDEIAVEPEIALSHHYSPCEAEETGCYLKSIVIDKTARRFTKKLAVKVAATCHAIFGPVECPTVKKEALA